MKPFLSFLFLLLAATATAQQLPMQSIGNNLWQSAPVARPFIVKINGIAKEPARTALITYPSATTNTITVSGVPAYPGGEVVIRKNNWTVDKGAISSQTSSSITYQNNTGDNGEPGWKFFIKNIQPTRQGDWYYNGRIVVFSTTQPTVEVFSTSTRNGSFDGVTFEGAELAATGGTFRNCTFKNISNIAIYANGGNLVVENCTFENIGNVAIKVINATYTIRGNTFKRIASDYGGRPTNITGLEYSCISISGGTGTIENNTIDSVGYNAIHFLFTPAIVRNNKVSNFNLTKDDGAGIYSWRTAGAIIDRNTVTNGIGAAAMRNNPSYLPVYGIYLDDDCNGFTVTNNTVEDMGGSGIFIHNAFNSIIRGNYVRNSGNSTADPLGVGQIQFLANGVNRIYGIRLARNKFVSLRSSQMVIKWDGPNARQFGTADSNCYITPNTVWMARVCEASCQLFNTSQWAAYTGQEANSLVCTNTLNLPEDPPAPTQRPRFGGFVTDHGHYWRIHKPGVLNVYRIDGALLQSVRVYKGQTIIKQTSTDKAILLY